MIYKLLFLVDPTNLSLKPVHSNRYYLRLFQKLKAKIDIKNIIVTWFRIFSSFAELDIFR